MHQHSKSDHFAKIAINADSFTKVQKAENQGKLCLGNVKSLRQPSHARDKMKQETQSRKSFQRLKLHNKAENENVDSLSASRNSKKENSH